MDQPIKPADRLKAELQTLSTDNLATLKRKSPCKVNLLLNVLGKRPDGFHELETVIYPLALYDELTFERIESGIEFTCNNPSLPVDSGNLVVKAAAKFLECAGAGKGVRIHLEKRLPLAAGLGAGSANAAVTLRALNEMSDHPLASLQEPAATIGSDVPFFLQDGPALAIGRGEKIEPLAPFKALAGSWFLLIHPGFGVSTPWAYANLASFPDQLNGTPGRAARLIGSLVSGDLETAARQFYNALEAPVLRKFPLLAIIADFLRDAGAAGVLMSGSGSTIFAIFDHEGLARDTEKRAQEKFARAWTATVPA